MPHSRCPRDSGPGATLPFGAPVPIAHPTEEAPIPLVKGRIASIEFTFDDSRMRAPVEVNTMKNTSLDWRGIPEGMLDEDEVSSPSAAQVDLPPKAQRKAPPSPERRRARRVRLTRAFFAVVFGAILALFAHEAWLVIKLGARPF